MTTFTQMPLLSDDELEKERYNIRDRQFAQICSLSGDLFREKNRKYHDGIRHTGVLGAAIEVFGAAMRLTVLVIKDPRHGRGNRKELLDVAKDIHNYSNILLIMMDENNWEGDL